MNLQQIHAHLHHQPMRGVQVLIVALGTMINMIDGFDILAASIVSPILNREWSLSPELLGSIVAAGPLGMAAGAFFLSPIADIYGRRNSIIFCLLLMTVGMLLSSLANSPATLIPLRFITGMGVGAMASSVGTMVFEFSSLKNRALGLGFVTVGYPFGATVGGFISQGLIDAYSWHAIFVFGGLCSALMIPLIFFLMPESVDYLVARQPKNALHKLNGVLRRLDLPQTTDMPAAPPTGQGKGNVFDLLRLPVRPRTMIMAFSYFLYMTSSYFFLGWANQMTVDAGYADEVGRGVLNIMNLGGIVGGIVIGVLCFKMRFKPIAVSIMITMGLAIIAFGIFDSHLALVRACAMLVGFGIFGGAVIMYSAAATTFPARVRATGVGLSMSAGRLGSAVGPQLAGVLFGAGLGRVDVCIILAIPVIISAFTLIKVPQTSLDDA